MGGYEPPKVHYKVLSNTFVKLRAMTSRRLSMVGRRRRNTRKTYPAKVVTKKVHYYPRVISAGNHGAKELRYSNGESRSHHGLVV